jgi:hypothetical protein
MGNVHRMKNNVVYLLLKEKSCEGITRASTIDSCRTPQYFFFT